MRCKLDSTENPRSFEILEEHTSVFKIQIFRLAFAIGSCRTFLGYGGACRIVLWLPFCVVWALVCLSPCFYAPYIMGRLHRHNMQSVEDHERVNQAGLHGGEEEIERQLLGLKSGKFPNWRRSMSALSRISFVCSCNIYYIIYIVYICIFMNTYIHTYVYAYINIHTYIYVYLFTYLHIFIFMKKHPQIRRVFSSGAFSWKCWKVDSGHKASYQGSAPSCTCCVSS